ncbi:MAG: ferredoxin [Oscillospiraceae bacterium]
MSIGRPVSSAVCVPAYARRCSASCRESAQAITEPVPQEYLAAAQEAADSCPVGAIELK